MWAEIHNKLTSNPATSEDMLTSNFFGALKYCSFESQIFHEILKGVSFINSSSQAQKRFEELLQKVKTNVTPNFKFWERRKNSEGRIDEIDVLVEFPPNTRFFIGFEMKYNSHLSSNDDSSEKQMNDNEQQEIEKSRNQLLRYAWTFSKDKEELDYYFFIIWGKEHMILEIKQGIEEDDKQNNEQKELANRNVFLGFLTWEKTFEQLTKMQKPNNLPDSIIREDLLRFLKHKNLDGFLEFSIPSKLVNRELFYEF